MKYSDTLKNKQNECFAKAQNILSLAEKESREMTAEENIAFEASMKEGADFDAKITDAIAKEDRLSKLAKPQTRKTDNATETAVSTVVHERAKDNPTRSYDGQSGLGDFATDVHRLGTGGGMSERLRIMSAAGDGLSAGVSTDGGVLIPPAFSQTIMDLTGYTSNSLMAECDQLPPLPDGVESMEFPAINETSRADGSRRGGIQGYWKAELTQMTSSKPTLKEVKFSPQQLFVFAFISDKLLKHAPQLSAFLAQSAADEINFKIGDSIFNGTGTGMPRGILTGAVDAPRVQIAKETNQAAATLVIQNLEKMYARMPANMRAGAKWYINQDVLPQLMDMTKAVGSGGSAVFMPNFNISGAPFGTIYGAPIYPTEYSATIGTEGDIIFANLKKYGLMTRGGIDSAMSIHLKFDYNQSAFRFIFEVDGQPWQSSSITPFKGTAKQSAIVTLATRA